MSGIAHKLKKDNLITEKEFLEIQKHEITKPFSIFWELRTLFYLGIVLLTTGLGVLIYKNIDSIGHNLIIGLITLSCFACFYYCKKKALPYSNFEIKNNSAFFDYTILLGCLLFVVLQGYIDYQYNIYNSSYAFPSLVTSLLFFGCAYYFDNRAILSLAITAIAAFVGLVLTPLDLLKSNDFSSINLIYKGIFLGLVLLLISSALKKKQIKEHFTFTWFNFSFHLLYISTLAGLFTENDLYFFITFLIVLLVGIIKYSRQSASFYFLLISIIYGFIGLTYLIFQFNLFHDFFLGTFYFVVACGLLIRFLLKYKKLKD